MLLRKRNGQNEFDASRDYYELVFPNEMSAEQIADFIVSIGDNLRGGSTWGGVPTVVFETWTNQASGIFYRMRVPWQSSAYVVTQLRGAIPGIDVVKLNGVDSTGFQDGRVIHMHNPSEELPIKDAGMFANRIVRSVQNAVTESDTLVIQTIIAHSPNQKMPPSDRPMTSNRGLQIARALLHADNVADRDEVKSRRAKQVEQNYIAITRIAARGKDVERAQHLVSLVEQAFTAERGHAYLYPKKVDPQRISQDIINATTPLDLTMQLSVTELTGVIGWPVGRIYVAGLRRGAIQHMPVPESVEREGIVIGKTTIPPHDRLVAISPKKALTHIYLGGSTEVGKTTMLVNIVRQLMEQGSGITIMERDGNLFEQALNQVPPHRVQDVIAIDTTQGDRFVGFNPLRTGKPEIIAGQFASLLNGVFKDAGESVYTQQLVRHGIPVLANMEKATLADLPRLVNPRTNEERDWALRAARSMKDPTYREFWENWIAKRDEKKRLADASAFYNRWYELFTPEATRYMLSQEESSFDPVDIITGNKLLFVNLAGVSEQVASVMGSLLVNAIWSVAKLPENTPDIPNFLVMDEFQQFSHLREETVDMFATARKRKLGLVVATQYIERLDKKVQSAVMANARNKLIFTSSVDSAYVHNREFAHQVVKAESFVNLPAFNVLARVNTENGVTDPITMLTFPEPGQPGANIQTTYNQARTILQMSASKYGRTAAEIDRATEIRRRGGATGPTLGDVYRQAADDQSNVRNMTEDDWK